VQPDGWLRAYLEKQAAQLGSKLPQVSWPFSDAFWAGEDVYKRQEMVCPPKNSLKLRWRNARHA